MKKLKFYLGFLLFALCIMMGILFQIYPGYKFSSWLCFGAAALLICYRILKLLSRKKPKTARILRRILTVCLCIGLLVASVTGIFIARAGIGQADVPCDYVIVLGAGVNGTTPSMILRERINRAYTYLSENPDVICIVSGGQGPGEDITEAQCMFDHLTARGIAPERIWLEDHSTSTRENIRFSLAVIESKTGSRPEKAAVISNEFHLFRASLMAGEQGLETIGVPAKTTWLSLRINYFLREIAGVWYYWILGG